MRKILGPEDVSAMRVFLAFPVRPRVKKNAGLAIVCDPPGIFLKPANRLSAPKLQAGRFAITYFPSLDLHDLLKVLLRQSRRNLDGLAAHGDHETARYRPV